MSHDPSAYTRHRIGDITRAHGGHGLLGSSIPNGEHLPRPHEGERKRNYKLLIDPVLKGRGHQKIYRFEGEFDGQAPVIPKDPRSRRTRLWSTRTKADLPVPKFKIDKFYVGIPPQRDVILNGLNDNVDKRFLQEICEKFGDIEGIKIFYDPLTKRHLGKARVGFTTSASAKLAVAKLNGTSIMGCIVHADFEHKVEVKHPAPKPQPPSHHGSDSVHKTPPMIERIAGHHVIPTPPPSNSSPVNSTPSTPGSLALTDPRRRNSSASSTSGDKQRNKSPLGWPTPLTQQNRVPVFEPISPPSDKPHLPIPPPPPPDGPPPPPLPEKCRTPSPIPSTTIQDRYQSKDSKSSLKGSKDSYKSSRYDDDSDRRRRDRNSGRDRYEHCSYRRSSDDRGSRYSRDHYSRDKDRDNYQRSDPRRSSYRDSESRRSRDSDDSYGSEKSFKSSKEISKSRHDYDSKDFDTRARSPRTFEKDKRDLKKTVNKSDDNFQHKVKLNSSDKSLNNGQSSSVHRSPIVDSLSFKSSPNMPEIIVGVGKNLDSTLQQDSTLSTGYLPVVEDISPVSSPTQPTPLSYPTLTQPVEFPTSEQPEALTTTAVQVESTMDNTVQTVSPEDNDDAMSLSSISSNEETLEVTKPVPPVPPVIPTFPPTYAPPVLPPPFMPPYNPSIPPPSYPAIPIVPHRIPIPPLSIATLPPPHPLVPPAFHPTYPPQFVSTLNGVPAPPVYQTFPTGHMPTPHEQRPPVRKNWKIRISEEVLKRVTEELAIILKKDVNKRLVENSAFKALDGWWDNAQKSKFKQFIQSDTPSTTINQTATTAETPDMTSPLTSPLSTNMSQGAMIGMGLRASLPKMPSFRKRHPPSGSDLYAKRKRASPERGQKRTATDSDSDASGRLRSDSPFPNKRARNEVGDDVSVGSPWQQDGDATDEPPAMSVRTEDKRSTFGSTLYTNIYSSLSESESSVSGESGSEDSGDDGSDWEEGSQGSPGTSDSEEETGKEEDKEIIPERKVPQTPPGTPPESPSLTPAVPTTPSNASITPTASPVDVTTIDDGAWGVEKDSDGLKLISQDNERTTGLQKDLTLDLKPSDLMDSTSGQEIANSQERVESLLGDEGLSEASSIITPHKHIPAKVDSTTDDSTVENCKFPELKQGGEALPVSKEPEPIYEPIVELPPEFPLRPYWQDDRLVYDFLVSGLDYEDACYLNIGFENLQQVGSDSVTDANWSFHPTTSPGVLTKGRKQKLDNCGVRLHDSGCARCEGYYKISMKEKAKYLEAARRQVDRSEAVKKDNAKEANKAKQQSRENRALQRRLAASFQNEDFGDILKFNQLKVRKKKLTFCKSRIHDWGLFALEPIARDEMVIEYVGEVVRQTIADDREKRYERLGIGSSYLFRVDSDTIIDATKYGNLARFINHCCEPNCYAKVVTFESEKKIVIYSKRDIAVNEEITYDYKFPLEDEKIPCLCGAAQCRGTLN